mmetsp:Transcript_38684/g.70921  ORF Transcript_38684/g.70921 Transcript_38684/m.70921 type:complete len:115 (+) Transcript_38684:400-744(+)
MLFDDWIFASFLPVNPPASPPTKIMTTAAPIEAMMRRHFKLFFRCFGAGEGGGAGEAERLPHQLLRLAAAAGGGGGGGGSRHGRRGQCDARHFTWHKRVQHVSIYSMLSREVQD